MQIQRARADAKKAVVSFGFQSFAGKSMEYCDESKKVSF